MLASALALCFLTEEALSRLCCKLFCMSVIVALRLTQASHSNWLKVIIISGKPCICKIDQIILALKILQLYTSCTCFNFFIAIIRLSVIFYGIAINKYM